MLLTEDSGIGDYHINAYGPDSVTVNKVTYTSSLLVSPYRLVLELGPRALDELGSEHIEAILALEPEIVILGTGQNFKWPSKTQLAPFHQRRIGIECMNTGAACRTYRALMSEGRKVVAALLIG
ncbi:Mth938-like domain-containing protein [Coxiella endosymbiont of Ornithodoros maritimus]|uniref:Mth938-like domain-containing protein n=1 Tax=Coxiella endosymbiont of Ornithodoros maritimus TaxID=1656172 RepID=UPI002265207F|nr:Mth938-like domain-containing protein [Coxiella endosymbiont of Ornithodoros maritimus]